MIKKLILAGSALLGAMVPSNAAVIVSMASSRPTEGVILATLNPDNTPESATLGTFSWRRNNATNSNNYDVGLGFKAETSGTLDELGLYVNSAGGGGGGNSFTLSIRESLTVPPASNGNVSGTLLDTITGTIDVAGDAGNILKFAFSGTDVVTLTANRYYTFTLVWGMGADSSKQFTLQLSSLATNDDDETVAVGGWHRAGGSTTWTQSTARNYLFYASSAIPEPSTYVLFGTAAVGMALYRRRKNTR